MPAGDHGDPLQGLRVLALGHDPSTSFAAWWLADCGADVAGYRPAWQPPAEDSDEALFERQVRRRVREADFPNDSPYDAVLGDETSIAELSADVPDELIANAWTVEVTSPYPTATTFADALIHDMAIYERSGLGFLTRESSPEQEYGGPAVPLNRQASFLAGVAAALAVVATGLARQDGASQAKRLAFDKLELLALMPMQPAAFAQLAGRIVGRGTNRAYPGGILRTTDGLVYMRPIEPKHWVSLFKRVGGLDWAIEAMTSVEATRRFLAEGAEVFHERLRDWTGNRTTEEVVEICQADHVPVVPISAPGATMQDEHLIEREFIHDDDDVVRLGLPWRPRVDDPVPAPASREDERELRPRTGLPLEDLRVLDLSWAWAAPFATTLLADLGAEVVHIEWGTSPSTMRGNPPYANDRSGTPDAAGWWSANQRGKFSLGVNYKDSDGIQIVKELAARSDVAIENFSPGVVARLGIGCEALREVNPRLVYISMSAFGQSGPHSHYIGYGTQLYFASGAGYATSRDGEGFSAMWIPYPDPVSGMAGAFALAAYLYNARASGRAAYADVSEFEALCAILLEPLLGAAGDSPAVPEAGPGADAVSYLVVEGADDRFVALLARQAADWDAYATALEASAATPEALRDAGSALDAEQIVARAEAAGLTAQPIQDSAEALADPLLNASGFWVPDESAEIAGTGARIGAPIWRIDGERAEIWRAAPPIFSDTGSVLIELLGYTPERIEELYASGAIK